MLFKDWFEAQGITKKAAADLFGTTPTTIYYWTIGRHCATAKNTKLIQRITQGQVTAVDLQRAYEIAHGGDL
jgi:DNA-binding transcriptional regulator YdaS (Cro superfamily)